MNPFQLEEELKQLLDRYSVNGTAPSSVLAKYMLACLDAFNEATERLSDPEGIAAAAKRFGKWPSGAPYVSKAQEIREATARNELHPLVAANVASPRGLCMASIQAPDGGVCWCARDYEHEGAHRNGSMAWEG